MMFPATRKRYAMLALIGVAMLAGAVIVSSFQRIRDDRAPSRKTELKLRHIATVLHDYRARYGNYPTDSDGLRVAVESLAGGETSVQSLLVDDWGNAFRYRNTEGVPVVYSLGPNSRDDSGEVDDLVMPRD
jgi:type II secretory pathway pseudopilin PulG